jgi:hypothetical protein
MGRGRPTRSSSPWHPRRRRRGAGSGVPPSRKFFTPPPTGEFTWTLHPPATLASRGEKSRPNNLRSEPRLGPTAGIAGGVMVRGAEAWSTCLCFVVGVDPFRLGRASLPAGVARADLPRGRRSKPSSPRRDLRACSSPSAARMPRRGGARGPSAGHIRAFPPRRVGCAAAPRRSRQRSPPSCCLCEGTLP